MKQKVFSTLSSFFIVTAMKTDFSVGSTSVNGNKLETRGIKTAVLRRLTSFAAAGSIDVFKSTEYDGEATPAPTDPKRGSIASRTTSVVAKKSSIKYPERMGIHFIKPEAAPPLTSPPTPIKKPTKSTIKSRSASTSTSTPVKKGGAVNSTSTSTSEPTAKTGADNSTSSASSTPMTNTVVHNNTNTSNLTSSGKISVTTNTSASSSTTMTSKTADSTGSNPTRVPGVSTFSTKEVAESVEAETAPSSNISNNSSRNNTRPSASGYDEDGVKNAVNKTISIPTDDSEELNSGRDATGLPSTDDSESSTASNTTDSLDDLDDVYADDFVKSLSSTKAPLTFPKEKEQPKYWPEVVGGIFVLTSIVSFGITAFKNYQKRKGYQMIPKAFDV